MSWITVGAAAISAAGTIYSATQTPQGRTTSGVEFPEETRRLFQHTELPILQGSLMEQNAMVAPFLGGNRNLDFLTSMYGQPPVNMATHAATRSAQDQDMTDLGPLFETLGGLQPEFLAALQSLVLQRGQQSTAIVPAGYGQFLSPSTFSQQSGGVDPYQSGFQIAGALANVGSSYFGKTS